VKDYLNKVSLLRKRERKRTSDVVYRLIISTSSNTNSTRKENVISSILVSILFLAVSNNYTSESVSRLIYSSWWWPISINDLNSLPPRGPSYIYIGIYLLLLPREHSLAIRHSPPFGYIFFCFWWLLTHAQAGATFNEENSKDWWYFFLLISLFTDFYRFYFYLSDPSIARDA